MPPKKKPAAPDPSRALGNVGTTFWRDAWAQGDWLRPVDTELLQMVCEQMDERAALRIRVLQGADERKELRDLDKLIIQGLQMLGFASNRPAPKPADHNSSWN